MRKKLWISLVASLISLVMIGGVVFAIVWGRTNYARVQEMMSGTNIYNKQDLDDAYQDGYETALSNQKEYIILINNYRDTIEALRVELQAEKEQAENDQAALQAVNDKLVKACAEYKTVIETLSNDELAVLSFECDGILHDIKVLPKGTKLDSVTSQIETPTKDGYRFVGWSLNGIDVIDPATVTIDSTTVCIAVFKQAFTVSFKNCGKGISGIEDYETQQVIEGGYPTNPVNPTGHNGYYSFCGWSSDGVTIVDVTAIAITDDTIYYAFYELQDIQRADTNTLGNSIWGQDYQWTFGVRTYYLKSGKLYFSIQGASDAYRYKLPVTDAYVNGSAVVLKINDGYGGEYINFYKFSHCGHPSGSHVIHMGNSIYSPILPSDPVTGEGPTLDEYLFEKCDPSVIA
ncbi:MAG: InlB B-repeat-containing protein [Prevotella sp.]|nr:InlB B-repeat-containing protein [Prevotella sp.]